MAKKKKNALVEIFFMMVPNFDGAKLWPNFGQFLPLIFFFLLIHLSSPAISYDGRIQRNLPVKKSGKATVVNHNTKYLIASTVWCL